MRVRNVYFFASDWLADTLDLSNEDRGTLITICALIWARGEAKLSTDILRRACVGHWRSVEASLTRLIEASRVLQEGAHITVKMAAEQLDGASKRIASWTENLPKTTKNNDVHEPRATRTRRTPSAPTAPLREREKKERNLTFLPSSHSEPHVRARARPPASSTSGAARSAINREEVNGSTWQGNNLMKELNPPDTPENRKTLLLQKLCRYVQATCSPEMAEAAMLGLMGGDYDHDEQWWCDAVDQRMKADGWHDGQQDGYVR